MPSSSVESESQPKSSLFVCFCYRRKFSFLGATILIVAIIKLIIHYTNRSQHDNVNIPSYYKNFSENNLNFKFEKFSHSTKSKFLVPEAMYLPINAPSKIEKISAIPLAFGNFDSDRYTDVFMLGNNGKNIYLLKGQSCVDGRTILTYLGSRRCLTIDRNFFCNLKNNRIFNLVASDFTGHLQQDLLITTESSDQINSNYYNIILVNGNTTTTSEFHCDKQINKILIKNAISEPFILDYNGDMITDFIVETDDCSLQLVIGGNFDDYNDDEYEIMKSRHFYCLSNMTKIKHLAKPHASGFLNLNSYKTDMTADIFINGENEFEYIFNKPQQGFQINKNNENIYKFPNYKLRGQSSFVDLNYDGKLQHIIPVCMNNEDETFQQCRQPNIMVFNSNTNDWHPLLDTLDSPLGSKFNRTLTFIDNELYGYIKIPVTLYIGDIDYDGYPDFATILYDVQMKKNVAAIFLNTNNSNNLFKLEWISDYSDNVRLISLFDIYNNGRLNLLIVTEEDSLKKQSFLTLHTYDYYVEKSLYFSFLRVNVISGLCSDKNEEHPCPNHLAYGSTPPGAMVCFAGPYINDHCCSVQMSQTSHFSLQSPYIIFGLGDVLNVINDLSVSISNGKNPSRIRKWNEIIPGSKLVIVPNEPDQIKNWQLRVFINMSIYSLVSLLFLFILGLLLTIAILILHFREKKEDQVDHQQYRKAWL